MMLVGLCILNHEDRKDRKEKMLAHLAAEQLDRVMDREEVAHHIFDWEKLFPGNLYRESLFQSKDYIEKVNTFSPEVAHQCSGCSNLVVINPQSIDQHFLNLT